MPSKIKAFPLDPVLNVIQDNRAVSEKVATSLEPSGPCGNSSRNGPDSYGTPESERLEMPSDSLRVLSKRELIALVRRRQFRLTDVDRQLLLSKTVQRLEVLRARVRERKHIDEASEFARWVLSSGLSRVLAGPDAHPMERLRQGVLYDCAEAWNNRGQGPWVAKSELEALNAKVDNLAQMLTQTLVGAHQPSAELKIVQ